MSWLGWRRKVGSAAAAPRPVESVPAVSTLHGVFGQARPQPSTVTLFKGWTRLTTDNHGEMQGKPLQGFFAAETRFITHYDIRLNDKPISHRLSTQLASHEWSSVGAILRSGDSGNLPQGTLPRGSLEVRILRRIDGGWSERIFIKNNGEQDRKIRFEVRFSCPIDDDELLEEMKKDRSLPWTGLVPRAFETEEGLGLRFERDFGRRRHAPEQELQRLYGEGAPRDRERVLRALEVEARPAGPGPRVRVRARPGKISVIEASCRLGGREELSLEFRYSAQINRTWLRAPGFRSTEPVPRLALTVPDGVLRVNSSNSTFNLILGQAMTDLRSLALPVFGDSGQGSRAAATIAGVPRYIGVFGRDSLVTAWQSALFGLGSVESALSRIALLQGVRKDDWRDEEPDRLPHERRLNPKADAGRCNRLLYYGDVTSTPFWILTLSELYRWKGEQDLLVRHRDTLARCCRWILRQLEHGGGLIYYAPAMPGREDENRNQAWKDSGDAIVDHRGRIRVPPLAMIEIQAYAFQALREAAELFGRLGDEAAGAPLLHAARRIRDRVRKEFWVERIGFYAMALDARRRPIAARASNVGHCLGTGLLDEARIPQVVSALLGPDLFSGWGIRTLSADNPGYDPFSYHRGAVWPVENALIARGLREQGYHAESRTLSTAQLGVAAIFQHMRLPEVFTGHSRSSQCPTPGLYNFGNLLQAWSVSAIAQHLQTILGIQPRAQDRRLYLDPSLPEWLGWIELRDLEIGSAKLHLRFWRDEGGSSRWRALGPTGDLVLLPGPAGRVEFDLPSAA